MFNSRENVQLGVSVHGEPPRRRKSGRVADRTSAARNHSPEEGLATCFRGHETGDAYITSRESAPPAQLFVVEPGGTSTVHYEYIQPQCLLARPDHINISATL